MNSEQKFKELCEAAKAGHTIEMKWSDGDKWDQITPEIMKNWEERIMTARIKRAPREWWIGKAVDDFRIEGNPHATWKDEPVTINETPVGPSTSPIREIVHVREVMD